MAEIFKKTAESKDGLNLYYETYINNTEKPVLFFLHGMGGDLDAWQYVRDKLLEKDYSAIAMDLRGHGYSDHPRKFESNRIENLADDVAEIMDKENIQKVVLVGHCYGAVVAEHFVLRYPERLEKLILISGTYRPPNYIFGKAVKAAAVGISNLGALISPKPYKPRHSDYPAGKFHKDYEWTGLVKTIAHNSLRSYLLASKEILKLQLEPELHKIKIPTLVIVGESDSIFPMKISEQIHKEIPESKFAVVKDANHVVILNNPNEVANLIDNYLRK